MKHPARGQFVRARIQRLGMGDPWGIPAPAHRLAIEVQTDLCAAIQRRRLTVVGLAPADERPELAPRSEFVPRAIEPEIDARPVDRLEPLDALTEGAADEDYVVCRDSLIARLRPGLVAIRVPGVRHVAAALVHRLEGRHGAPLVRPAAV